MIAAIIVAAGQGTRMGEGVDKLFVPVAGRPVIAHTWARFDHAPNLGEVVLVVREDARAAYANLASEYGFTRTHRIVAGGAQRQDSVWNGLQALSPEVEVVLIHDGARPCVTAETLMATAAAAARSGAAVTAQRVVDTLKESDGGPWIARTVDRSRLWAVQTPQAFRVEVIRRALRHVRESGWVVTDDTAACELIGQRVELVENRAPNPKVTIPSDLPFVEWLLSRSSMGGV